MRESVLLVMLDEYGNIKREFFKTVTEAKETAGARIDNSGWMLLDIIVKKH